MPFLMPKWWFYNASMKYSPTVKCTRHPPSAGDLNIMQQRLVFMGFRSIRLFGTLGLPVEFIILDSHLRYHRAEYSQVMTEYKFTEYFENEVLRKRPYLKKDWCVFVIENAVRSEPQENNRHRYWASISELDGRYLRVITLEDKVTIHNAFPDRGFKP